MVVLGAETLMCLLQLTDPHTITDWSTLAATNGIDSDELPGTQNARGSDVGVEGLSQAGTRRLVRNRFSPPADPTAAAASARQDGH